MKSSQGPLILTRIPQSKALRCTITVLLLALEWSGGAH